MDQFRRPDEGVMRERAHACQKIIEAWQSYPVDVARLRAALDPVDVEVAVEMLERLTSQDLHNIAHAHGDAQRQHDIRLAVEHLEACVRLQNMFTELEWHVVTDFERRLGEALRTATVRGTGVWKQFEKVKEVRAEVEEQMVQRRTFADVVGREDLTPEMLADALSEADDAVTCPVLASAIDGRFANIEYALNAGEKRRAVVEAWKFFTLLAHAAHGMSKAEWQEVQKFAKELKDVSKNGPLIDVEKEKAETEAQRAFADGQEWFAGRNAHGEIAPHESKEDVDVVGIADRMYLLLREPHLRLDVITRQLAPLAQEQLVQVFGHLAKRGSSVTARLWEIAHAANVPPEMRPWFKGAAEQAEKEAYESDMQRLLGYLTMGPFEGQYVKYQFSSVSPQMQSEVLQRWYKTLSVGLDTHEGRAIAIELLRYISPMTEAFTLSARYYVQKMTETLAAMLPNMEAEERERCSRALVARVRDMIVAGEELALPYFLMTARDFTGEDAYRACDEVVRGVRLGVYVGRMSQIARGMALAADTIGASTPWGKGIMELRDVLLVNDPTERAKREQHERAREQQLQYLREALRSDAALHGAKVLDATPALTGEDRSAEVKEYVKVTEDDLLADIDRKMNILHGIRQGITPSTFTESNEALKKAWEQRDAERHEAMVRGLEDGLIFAAGERLAKFYHQDWQTQPRYIDAALQGFAKLLKNGRTPQYVLRMAQESGFGADVMKKIEDLAAPQQEDTRPKRQKKQKK